MGRGLSDLQRVILEMAYKNRVFEWEPKPKAYRVLVFDSPEKDLRTLVPEAFKRFPDGYWADKTFNISLIAGSFSNGGAAEEFGKELEKRGLQVKVVAYPRYAMDDTPDLFTTEVYCAVYGFEEGSYLLGDWIPKSLHVPGFPNARFARDWGNIGTGTSVPNYKNPRYNSARPAVARAFNRLVNRGLAERGSYASINLTERGLETARELLVNKGENLTFVVHCGDGVARELTVSKDDDISFANHYEQEAARLRAVVHEDPRDQSESGSESLEALQNIFNPSPPPLVDSFFNAIGLHLLYLGETTEEEIREAFEEALRRVKEPREEKETAPEDEERLAV